MAAARCVACKKLYATQDANVTYLKRVKIYECPHCHNLQKDVRYVKVAGATPHR